MHFLYLVDPLQWVLPDMMGMWAGYSECFQSVVSLKTWPLVRHAESWGSSPTSWMESAFELYSQRIHGTQSRPTVCSPVDCSPSGSFCPWSFPGRNTGVGCHLLLQGMFLPQGSNLHLLHLRQWQVNSLPLSHLGTDSLGIEKYCVIGAVYSDEHKQWFCEGNKLIQTALLYFTQISSPQDIKETDRGQSTWKPDVYWWVLFLGWVQ